jgi:hypothetical protein
MAKAKKTKQPKVEEVEQINEPLTTEEIAVPDISEEEMRNRILTITQKEYKECEWCYQFDEDEAQVFAWTNENDSSDEPPSVTFTLTNNNNSYITFKHKDKLFKLFARELTQAGIDLRNNAMQDQENLQNDLENESTNKEA